MHAPANQITFHVLLDQERQPGVIQSTSVGNRNAAAVTLIALLNKDSIRDDYDL